jgi:predicted Zn-dependent protease
MIGLTQEMKAADAVLNSLASKIKRTEKRLSRTKNIKARTRIEKELCDLKEDLAWSMIEAHEYEKAAGLYTELPWAGYEYAKYLGLGITLGETGHIEEARSVLERGLQDFPESAGLWTALGNICKTLGEWHEALKYFEQAESLDPEDQTLRFNTATALYGLQCYEEAAAILRQLVEEAPDQPLFINQLGYCYLNTGYPETAAEYFKQLIEDGYCTADNYNGLFCSYIDMNLSSAALEIAQEAFINAQDADSTLYLNLAGAYAEHNWIEDGKVVLKKGLEKYPDDSDLQEMLKDMEGDDGNDDKHKTPPFAGLLLIMLLIRQIKKHNSNNE